MRLAFLLFAAVPVAMLLQACSSDESSGVAPECTDDTQCDGNDVCSSAGACVPFKQTTTSTTGAGGSGSGSTSSGAGGGCVSGYTCKEKITTDCPGNETLCESPSGNLLFSYALCIGMNCDVACQGVMSLCSIPVGPCQTCIDQSCDAERQACLADD